MQTSGGRWTTLVGGSNTLGSGAAFPVHMGSRFTLPRKTRGSPGPAVRTWKHGDPMTLRASSVALGLRSGGQRVQRRF